MKRRLYKSGTKWCVWRWTITDSEYITRLHILKTPWFAICLHWINKPDPEPYLHDHPVSFLSIILRGWYAEIRQRGGTLGKLCRRKWFNWIPASRDDRHTIYNVSPDGALTLCFMGPKTQEWGFHGVALNEQRELVNAPGEWLYWKIYHHAQRTQKAQVA